jgi:hypothetical protein
LHRNDPMRHLTPIRLSFSTETLRRDADEIEACGGGNEARCMRWAADEIERLQSVEAELNNLKEGRTLLLPISRDHADKMVLIGEAFLKPQSS